MKALVYEAGGIVRSRNAHVFRINWPYLSIAALLLVAEVCIAAFVHDQFVRPHIGDLLVVMLMYFFVRGITRIRPLAVAMGVLAFAFLVEFTQYLHLIEHLGLKHSTAAKLILGNTFQWLDLAAYTCGTALALLLDRQLTPDRTSTRTPIA